jgi:hypothetical protein
MLPEHVRLNPLLFLLFVLILSTIAAIARADASGESRLLEPAECRFSSRFSQERAFPDGMNYLKTSGKLYFDCEHGLIWTMEVPIASTQIFLASGAMYDLNFLDELREIENPIQRQVGSLLSALLRGDRRRLESDFALQVSENALELKPRSRLLKRALRSIVIRETEARRIVMIEQSDGQALTVSIGEIEIYPDLEDYQSCSQALKKAGALSCDTLLKHGAVMP